MRMITLLMFALMHSAQASSYFIEKTQVTGASVEDTASVHELFRTEATHVEGATVAPKASDADYVLHPKIVRLGKALIVVLEKTDPAGKLIYSSQAKAENIEEMDTIATRLVRSVITEVPLKADAQVGDVTANEVKNGTQKKESASFWMLGFGPSLLGGVGSQGVSYGLTLGYNADIENTASLRIFWDGSFNGQTAYNDFALGGLYFFNEKKNSLFIGADFGYGIVRDSFEHRQDGFALGFGPGVRIFRTSKVNLEIQARFSFLSNTLNGSTPTVAEIRGTILYFSK